MIEIDGEKYCTAKEAASHLGVSRGTFYNNVKRHVPLHELGARKRKFYKLSELEPLRTVRTLSPELPLAV